MPLLLAWLVVSVGRHFYGWEGSPNVSGFGPVRLRLHLPGTAGRIPEPVLVCGRVGHAALVYIRLLKGPRAKVGVEFWGVGAYESTEFPLPAADAFIDFTCWLPVLAAPEGDRSWQSIPLKEQRVRRHQYTLEVDGVVRLQGTTDYKQPAHSALYLGYNPLGGSLVSSEFTGQISRVAAPSR